MKLIDNLQKCKCNTGDHHTVSCYQDIHDVMIECNFQQWPYKMKSEEIVNFHEGRSYKLIEDGVEYTCDPNKSTHTKYYLNIIGDK